MKAVIFDDFGGPEVLRVAEVDPPAPGPRQVRVRVHAAGVNPIDYKIRRGLMRPGLPAKLPAIPGSEAAGVVEEVGAEVTHVRLGDEVFGWTRGGGYCEQAILTTCAVKPAEVSWVDAVSLPVAGETATRVLRLLELKAGETLLVHGAAGAVGTLAVQLGTALGARVIGTAGSSNQEYVASLGGVPTLYGEGLVGRVRALAPEGVDAVFDIAGRGALPDSIELRGGTTDRIITIADYQGSETLGVRFTGGGSESAASAELLEDLAARVARGELKTTVTATFPLEEAAEAQRLNEAGHGRGKIVITVD
ncbi:NADP-dependent oxidoreductase [Actinospica sp. MGRD01-02]|uniref:NADP-dependent oxidoreductase n=1 Tax=Actinospica acidithermotolerans TaxID=2828514 RepID=A0A941ED41_9ACTN|nr:NADP-dependent oxidoreductase [Actinospica acidithermotolerans]MBR7830540.1 NADP-dependent oxidoreductase [Actinospica acidithermotolerans]